MKVFHKLPVSQWNGQYLSATENFQDGIFVLMGKPANAKSHLVLEKDLEPHDTLEIYEGVGVCGKPCSRIQNESTDICLDCLKHMKRIRQGWLYDEENDEWYDPKE